MRDKIYLQYALLLRKRTVEKIHKKTGEFYKKLCITEIFRKLG